MAASDHLQPKQFFHGTSAQFNPGDELTPEGANEYGRNWDTASDPDSMYFTSDKSEAHSWGRYAARQRPGSDARVYSVAPRGPYSPDGGMKDAYATGHALRVIGEA